MRRDRANRDEHGCPRQRTRCRRPLHGFTLLELLLVLALVVLMAGLAWPALRSSMAKSRLRDSAQQLRIELARARLTAMECGVPLEFRYRAGEGRFRIAAQPADEPESDVHASSGQRGIGRSKSALSKEGAADTELDWHVSETTLPDGVVFAAPQESPAESPPPADLASEAFEDDSLQRDGWSPAIVFHPDGTASNATLALSDGEGSQVTVQLRGVTGQAKPGDVESCDEMNTSSKAALRPLKTAREDSAPLVR